MESEEHRRCPVCLKVLATVGGRRSHQKQKNHYEEAIPTDARHHGQIPHGLESESEDGSDLNDQLEDMDNKSDLQEKKRAKKERQRAKRQRRFEIIRKT